MGIERPSNSRKFSTVAAWIFATAALASLVSVPFIRAIISESDFAKANVMVGIAVAFAWVLATIAVWLAPMPRIAWRTMCATPLVCGLVFVALFKFERVDGDLLPRFQWRYETPEPLPQVSAKRTSELANADAPGSDSPSHEATSPISDSPNTAPSNTPTVVSPKMIEERSIDSRQFFGPDRSGRYDAIELSSNWQENPPKIAWKQPIGNGWSSFSIQGDMAVTMEQRDAAEWVSAYSILDGELLWQASIDARHANVLGGTGPRSTPTLADGRVYACSAVSELRCLELATGQTLWSQDLLQLGNTTQSEFETQVSWGRAASPLVANGKVVVPLGGVETVQTLIAFDCKSGQELWRSGTDQISYSSPILAKMLGVWQIVLISESAVSGYSIDDGKLLWSEPWPGSSSNNASVSQPVVIDQTRIVVTKGYGEGAKLLRLSVSDSGVWSVENVWVNKTGLRTKFTSAVAYDGYLFGLSDGILECLDAETGKRQWKQGRYRQGQLLLVGDLLLISGERGEVALVQAVPDKFIELATMNVLDGVSWNVPALSANRLLIRNSNEAACVILPVQENPASQPGINRSKAVTS